MNGECESKGGKIRNKERDIVKLWSVGGRRKEIVERGGVRYDRKNMER